MSDIFEEVEEDYRRERLVTTIRKGWPWALGALALLLAGVWFAQWYGQHSLQQRRVFSEKFVEAQALVEADQWAEAETKLAELLKQAPKDYIAPLHMERAAVFIGQEKTDAALAAFDAASASADTPLLKNLARLQAAYVSADLPGTTRATLTTRLQPLISAGGPMGLLAREILALEDAEAGNVAAARKAYEYINLQLEAPPNLRQRAQTMLALLPEPENAAAASEPAPGEPDAAAKSTAEPGSAP